MDVASFLTEIKHHSQYADQLVHVEELPERAGRFAEPGEPLPEPLQRLLAARGITRLYEHQALALDTARAGRDLVVVSGTASGKTLCYNLPILETCLANSQARALYLFPTKALAQDQLKGQVEFLAGDDEVARRIRPGVYDGDTPRSRRRQIKADANLILSNPDMLHGSILPYHPKWSRFFSELQYVVLDELHTYRGILGAHVACVLRRLQRICTHYGSCPLFLAASATIANPGELATRLVGRDVAVIDVDGSPRGRKFFALWNPWRGEQAHATPHQTFPSGTGGAASESSGNLTANVGSASATDDAVWLMTAAMEANGQVLAFTRTRQATELINRYVHQAFIKRGSPLAHQIRAYRGGYLPRERRDIEQDLFAGRLRGVAATNALELGIDIGSLDVTLLVHYPGTIASSWQQAGRSGRRHNESLTVLLAGNDPVDQYFLRHPRYFFSQSPEHAVVDPENPYVLAKHVQAATFELPLDETSIALFGESARSVAAILADSGHLACIDGTYYFSGSQNPAQQISLRHMSDSTFSIVFRETGEARSAHAAGPSGRKLDGVEGAGRCSRRIADSRRDRNAREQAVRDGSTARKGSSSNHEVIANVDAISAPELIYPEAVYLHNGQSYFVRELDLEGRVAYVERHEMDYYTQAILDSNVDIRRTTSQREAMPHARLGFGEVDVTWKTVAFKKIKFSTRENVGYGTVDLPAQSLPTTAFWLTPTAQVRQQLKTAGYRPSEALCGLRNLAVVALPMVAMCDSRDISGVVDSQNLGSSTLILYDRYPGGLGYSERGYVELETLLKISQEMIMECECEAGCPSCVGLPNLRPAMHSDPDLMRGYPIPDKPATIHLLSLLCSQTVPA
ncbi:MAG: DEAD/DEAH box helicase [Planctomycetota bacterium]